MPRPKRENPRPNGRAKLEIDWDRVDHMLEAGCTGVNVASSIGCHPDTLYHRCLDERGVGFSQYAASKKACGDSRLYERQFDLAVEGNVTMLIFLGKVRLGQCEARHDSASQDMGLLVQALQRLADAPANEQIREKC